MNVLRDIARDIAREFDHYRTLSKAPQHPPVRACVAQSAPRRNNQEHHGPVFHRRPFGVFARAAFRCASIAMRGHRTPVDYHFQSAFKTNCKLNLDTEITLYMLYVPERSLIYWAISRVKDVATSICAICQRHAKPTSNATNDENQHNSSL